MYSLPLAPYLFSSLSLISLSSASVYLNQSPRSFQRQYFDTVASFCVPRVCFIRLKPRCNVHFPCSFYKVCHHRYTLQICTGGRVRVYNIKYCICLCIRHANHCHLGVYWRMYAFLSFACNANSSVSSMQAVGSCHLYHACKETLAIFALHIFQGGLQSG